MSRSTLSQNLLANVAGRTWATLLGLLFVPVYIRLMGIESYGLIGVFLSVAALLSVLDMGLSPTLSRELARLSVDTSSESARESRDLVRTFEVVFWVTGAAIGVLLAIIAGLVARHWVTASTIPLETIERAFVIMGLVIAVQWPSAVYDGGLTGLQHQVRLNGIRVAMATLQNVGAVLILWLVSPSILAYFAWQGLISLAQTLLLRRSLWRSLPPGGKSAFGASLLRKHSRFAAGMTGITVTSIILTQSDKIILSKLVALDVFGYYVLASTVAYSLTYLVTPIFSALFPRFSQVFAAHVDEASLSALYHRSAQWVSALVLPAAAVLTLFTDEVILLWTGNPVIVANAAPLARLLTIGSCLNALMFMPYLLQVASGWTRLAFLKNVVAVVVLVPLLTWGVSRYGAVAGAAAWIALNLCYVLIEVPLMHRRLLARDMWSWYRLALAVPLVAVLGVASISRALLPRDAPSPLTALWIVATGAAALVAASLAMPATRAWLRERARLP